MSVKLMNSLKIKQLICIYTIFSLYYLYYIAYANLSCIRILTSHGSLNELLMCRLDRADGGSDSWWNGMSRVHLWGCFWKQAALESVDWVTKATLSNVVGAIQAEQYREVHLLPPSDISASGPQALGLNDLASQGSGRWTVGSRHTRLGKRLSLSTSPWLCCCSSCREGGALTLTLSSVPMTLGPSVCLGHCMKPPVEKASGCTLPTLTKPFLSLFIWYLISGRNP